MKFLLVFISTIAAFRTGPIKMVSNPKQIIDSVYDKAALGTEWSNMDVYNNHIDSAAILQNQKSILFSSDGLIHKYNYIDANIGTLISFLEQHKINYQVFNFNEQTPDYLSFGFQFVFGYFVLSFLFNLLRNGGMGGNMMNQVSNKYNTLDKVVDTRFEDVAGITEAKNELIEIVDYLKNPSKYSGVGAKIPKGVLLEGPPGTGKTLLARAVAGEAGVSFISATGSSFVEMFVGVGASRVRTLFDKARENKPCVIFIDEIDAIGGKRGYGFNTGGNDEREQTLNQLLTNMDGFEQDDGIVVLAATNRADMLDQALKRSGRFDRKVAVSLPDFVGRQEIFKVHTRNKILGNVSFESISRLTSGFSGADIETLANEAALLSVRDNKTFIDDSLIQKAFEKMVIGLPKINDTRSNYTKTLVAVHETGHAMMVRYFHDYFTLQRVTINSNTGGAGGYTLFTPNDNFDEYPTKGYFIAQIIISLGGRAAEIIHFRNSSLNNILDDYTDISVTTGASNDLKQANNLARQYFKLFEDFTPEDPSESTKNEIDKKSKMFIEECLYKAISIIDDNKISFDTLTRLLLEENTIIYEDSSR